MDTGWSKKKLRTFVVLSELIKKLSQDNFSECGREVSNLNFKLLFFKFGSVIFELWLSKVERHFSKRTKIRQKWVIKMSLRESGKKRKQNAIFIIVTTQLFFFFMIKIFTSL